MENVYQRKGYKNRTDYLMGLAEEYGVPYDAVLSAAFTLGENEDFDGLPSLLEEWGD